MTHQPFFHTDCPACGAPVEVDSPTAITVVCSYCSSMLTIRDHTLHDTGRDSVLLEDFSPLKIGTTGRFSALDFVLIGRIQARYEAGMWNEWYARFEDGSYGWLAEAGDLYVFTRQTHSPTAYPDFDTIRAGETTLHYGKNFMASDVRQITLSNTAAQGELPFVLPDEWQNQVADWRCEDYFLTLDYSHTPPLAFLGRVVRLEELSLQLIRSVYEICASTGKIKGSRQAEHCPHCGSSVKWITGLTQFVICQYCGSELRIDEDTAQLIAAHTMRQAQKNALTLPVGKKGSWHDARQNTTVMVMGAVRYEELNADDAIAALNGYPNEGILPIGYWTEYLIYSVEKGFFWLIETPEDGWFVSHTLSKFPRLNTSGIPQGSHLLYQYGGRVSYAVGAFYWQIRAGDIHYYSDYLLGKTNKLCAERSRNELAWSQSSPIHFKDIAKAFHLSNVSTQTDDEKPSTFLVLTLMIFYVILNIPVWFQIFLYRGELLIEFISINAIALYILYTPLRNKD